MQFVKHGKEGQECFVEVDILLNKEILNLKRVISDGSKQRKWFINREPSSLEKLKETLAKHSIDMENLCTFMPQDKVGLFSQYNPKEILQKTLQAITFPTGNGQSYYDIQMELTSVEVNKASRGRDLEFKKTTKANLERDLENMQIEIRRIQRREELKVRVECYKEKAIVLDCSECLTSFEDKQKAVDDATSLLTAAKDLIQPLETAGDAYDILYSSL